MCTCYPIINRVSELKVHIELTRFVQPEKIEIDANERAVNEKSPYCFFVCTTFDSFLNDFYFLIHLYTNLIKKNWLCSLQCLKNNYPALFVYSFFKASSSNILLKKGTAFQKRPLPSSLSFVEKYQAVYDYLEKETTLRELV